MSTPTTPRPFRRLIVGMGVAGAAVLASAFTLAPAAVAADETPAPDTTTEPTPDPTPTDDPLPEETEAPTDEPTLPSEAPTATPTEPAEDENVEKSEAQVEALVEPDFGYQKFRVGVRIDDGSTIPAGVTTLGSEISIVETGPEVSGGSSTTTCTTTLVDGSDPTATFCEGLSPINDNYFARTGSTVTVTQTTVNDGLEIIDGEKIVVPCADPATCPDPFEGDVLLTDAVLDDDDDDDDSDEDDDRDEGGDDRDDTDNEVLPDTGAPDTRLLAYGAALLAIGGRLVMGGRRPQGRHVAVD